MPHLIVPEDVHASDTVVIGTAGDDPGADVTVVVYGPGQPAGGNYPKRYERLEVLPTATADGQGEAHLTWTVPARTTEEEYALCLHPVSECTVRQLVDAVP